MYVLTSVASSYYNKNIFLIIGPRKLYFECDLYMPHRNFRFTLALKELQNNLVWIKGLTYL
jgi:hypothetical protein